MIKVDTKKYNWDVINSIYAGKLENGKPGPVVEKLVKNIDHYLKKNDPCLIICKLMSQWFCDSGSGSISAEMVSKFLLDEHPEKYIREYKAIFCKNPICQSKPNQSKKQTTKLIKDLKSIFNYKWLSDNYRHKLLSATNVEVCPYCNRQYISNYQINGDGKADTRATADIDHFYLKSKYPFLALSLFNFIPSCPICNSRFKLELDYHGINPLQRGFNDDAIFQFNAVDDILYAFDTSHPIKYRLINISNDQEINESMKVFHLDEIYQSHQDYVRELAKKVSIYNKDYVKLLDDDFPQLSVTPYETQCLVFGNYLHEEDLGKRPLAKLTRDLLKNAGIVIE